MVVGSWLLDAYSMEYMCRKYKIKAFCICREQYAIDAYTLWGGISSGGYYASKNNMICPAQTEEMQISAPVFRMLGADPIYNYDSTKYFSGETVYVWTMEPGWTCGQNPDIYDWYLETYYKTPCLAFSHATTGQENTFGWEEKLIPNSKGVAVGYPMQIEKLTKLQAEGFVHMEKLGETGENFKMAFKTTPPQAQVVNTDWNGNGIKTVWYNCKNYRSNIFLKGGKLVFRDINLYDENYPERYLEVPCEKWMAVYDTLPILDTFVWSLEGKECFLTIQKEVKDIITSEIDEIKLRVDIQYTDGSNGYILFKETGIHLGNVNLHLNFGTPKETEIDLVDGRIIARHNGFSYGLSILGDIRKTDSGFDILEKGGEIIFKVKE